jgi:hypothetical protein
MMELAMATLRELVFGDQADPEIQLVELFGHSPNSVEGLAGAVEWGQGVLESADVTASKENMLLAIRALRMADRRLNLRPAVHLAGLLAA